MQILDFSGCHPHYTQQLAYYCWNFLERNPSSEINTEEIIDQIVKDHYNDFERLWNTLNKTDQKIMIELATKDTWSLQELTSSIPTSTVYSGLKRLSSKGYVVRDEKYELDDPFFKRWIIGKRVE